MEKIKRIINLQEEVYKKIKEAILSRQLYPGMKVEERELLKTLGVSRTPIREACARLASEGLLTIKPQKGVYVFRITAQDLIELLYNREVLEGLAARLFTKLAKEKEIKELKKILKDFTEQNIEERIEAYNLANVDFHNFIIEGSRNKRLISLISSMYDHLAMAKSIKVISLVGRGGKSFKEHQNIINAIEGKNEKEAEISMKEHITSLRKDIIANLEKLQIIK